MSRDITLVRARGLEPPPPKGPGPNPGASANSATPASGHTIDGPRWRVSAAPHLRTGGKARDARRATGRRRSPGYSRRVPPAPPPTPLLAPIEPDPPVDRSEERRVGK